MNLSVVVASAPSGSALWILVELALVGDAVQ